MSAWIWYFIAIGWAIFTVEHFRDQMSNGLAVAIGIYAALWFLVGNAQGRR